ncbi:MAG TPA: M20/M25/M40 family metallo-hydrolase [Parafilimonas sp.]|nr:M20/M25/M40 family metallo-hydrolase [Parafilimonas sp.]
MRKLFLAACLLSFCISAVVAQEKADLQMMQKIRNEEKNNSQITMIAHNITDVCGPRLTNSPGYNRALDWITQTLKQWGLENAGREAWGEFGRGWSTEESYLAMKQPYYQPIIAYPVAWTNGTKKSITADVILVNKLDSATIDSLGKNLKGKIVMVKATNTQLHSAFKAYATRFDSTVLDTLPDTYMLTRAQLDYFLPFIQNEYKTKLYLQSKGAAALLTSNSGSRDGTIFVDGTPAYAKGYQATLPEMVVSREDYLKLQRLLLDNKTVQLEMNVKNKFYDDDLTGYNVVGEIPGTDPALKSQVVMIGGHLDSWHSGTGATDNGAGCIVMMEAIRILKALNIQPRRTIRIALWGGEEQGLYGSFGYVKKHFGDPKDMVLTPEQKNISAYYNLDNGSGKIRGIFLQNDDSVKEIFKAWLEPFADMGATGITRSNTGSTDHLSFDAVGIPGFQFIQDGLEYETRTHHSNMDTYDHLSIEDLQQAATIVAAFAYNTAMRDEMLPRKPLPKPERFLFDTDVPL